jgi:hypothetical protein
MPQFSKKRRRSAPPGMLRHASGQARVILDGETVYLGKFGTPEAHARYAEVVQRWRAGQPVRESRPRTVVEAARSVAEVVLLYDKWMDETRAYSKGGKPTTQRGLIRVALRELNRFAGDLAADQFTPATLVAHRDKLAAKPKLSAQGVNRKVGLIKQFVAWAAERGHMPETNAAVIRATRSLRVTGKKRREPVPLADMTKAIAKLRPHFADMVRGEPQRARHPGVFEFLHHVDTLGRGERCDGRALPREPVAAHLSFARDPEVADRPGWRGRRGPVWWLRCGRAFLLGRLTVVLRIHVQPTHRSSGRNLQGKRDCVPKHGIDPGE